MPGASCSWGQVAVDGSGQVVGAGDFAAQAAQVVPNLEAILAEAGCTLRNVVKFTTYLTRHEDFTVFTAWRKMAYPTLFPDGVYPPSTGVVVSSLVRPELLLEIDAIAVRPARAGGVAARGSRASRREAPRRKRRPRAGSRARRR
jgi:enamine deaminase RidA (YjgF/YER057c/UK114 family)